MLALCCALSHVLFFAIPRTGACQAPLSMEFSSQEYWSSWSEMGKQWKRWETLFSWAPKSLQMVTAAMKSKDACSLEEKLWKPRQHTKKQRHYFASKGPGSQSCGFPVVVYGWKSWTLKKAEHWRIDAFELWCWRSLLRVPWTSRRSNQSIPKESNPEYSLEGLMMKLKVQ